VRGNSFIELMLENGNILPEWVERVYYIVERMKFTCDYHIPKN